MEMIYFEGHKKTPFRLLQGDSTPRPCAVANGPYPKPALSPPPAYPTISLKLLITPWPCRSDAEGLPGRTHNNVCIPARWAASTSAVVSEMKSTSDACR